MTSHIQCYDIGQCPSVIISPTGFFELHQYSNGSDHKLSVRATQSGNAGQITLLEFTYSVWSVLGIEWGASFSFSVGLADIFDTSECR